MSIAWNWDGETAKPASVSNFDRMSPETASPVNMAEGGHFLVGNAVEKDPQLSIGLKQTIRLGDFGNGEAGFPTVIRQDNYNVGFELVTTSL